MHIHGKSNSTMKFYLLLCKYYPDSNILLLNIIFTERRVANYFIYDILVLVGLDACMKVAEMCTTGN